MMGEGRVVVSLLILLIHCASICWTFLPNFWSRVLTLSWDSHTHQYMTEQALLNVTKETLKKMPGYQQDTSGQASLGRAFWQAVGEVVNANADMDFLSSTYSDPVYHFDSERVEEATEMLRHFWNQTVSHTQMKNYGRARASLGQLLHSLQDFYSHSNWVEMGQYSEYRHLLHPGEPAVPVASEDTPTCAGCHRFSCYNNLLEDLVRDPQQPLLTTGYFSAYPAKPTGKCSHGGILDSSRHQGAEGGINKDSTSPLFSPHHYLHKDAAQLATTATLSVLRDLQGEVGPKSFLRLFSVHQPPALVFVMDTTGSMFEEITAARMRVLSIIQARARNQSPGLPGTFLLVPFNDPDVGPVRKTDDPDEFQHFMEELMALRGGDEPEMCLTAVQLALIHSPALSEIFVFTDASPKDSHLEDTVKALILEKKSKVTFLLTEDPSYGTSGRAMGKRRRREALSPDRFSIYSSLSSLSGGMTIFTSNKDIHKASAIVEDSTASSKVTLFHAESEADSSHSFTVDRGVSSVTLHVAGKLTQCVLVNPTGAHQSLLSEAGPLAELDQSEGLYRVSLLPPIEPGQWQLSTTAHGAVTFSVLGESTLDFLYYFAVEMNETHPGLKRVEGSPVAGVPTFLVVVITGLTSSDEASFSHVTLLGTTGESLQKILLNSSGLSGEELVGHMDSVPRMPFSVCLSGTDGKGNELERVSSETVQPTHVQIQVLSAPHLLSGHHSTVLFEVFNHGPARWFRMTAEDDHGYLSEVKLHRFSIGERGSVRLDVELRTPHSAQAGQTVTLTLTVQAQDSSDSNYAVVHLTVLAEEPDMSPPSCSAMRVELDCPPQCSLGNWSVSLAVKDRGHSGLASVQLAEGQGILTLLHEETTAITEHPLTQLHEEATEGHVSPLMQLHKETTEHQHHKHRTRHGHTSHRLEKARLVYGEPPLDISEWAGRKPIAVQYSSSCCAPKAELQVWDTAGNMRRCHLIASQQRALREKEKNCAPIRTVHMILVLSLLTLCTF
ncbi:hypothetical protein NFI96_016086 [Prochilodus magdalenae]|nr:hypothetical protein NFI96_016086 [Prochilodus magdalenae]